MCDSLRIRTCLNVVKLFSKTSKMIFIFVSFRRFCNLDFRYENCPCQRCHDNNQESYYTIILIILKVHQDIATFWENGASSMDKRMSSSFHSTAILTLTASSSVFCRFFSLILHQRNLRKLKKIAQLSNYHTFNYVFLQKS